MKDRQKIRKEKDCKNIKNGDKWKEKKNERLRKYERERERKRGGRFKSYVMFTNLSGSNLDR